MLRPSDRPLAADSAAEALSSDPIVKPVRPAPKKRVKKLFVVDTNVLLHDPTSLFRFEENDVYLPIGTLEELDTHKRGLSDLSRNARQASRFLDEIVSDAVANIKVKPDGLNNDLHASPEYRAHLITVMAKRAVEAALK